MGARGRPRATVDPSELLDDRQPATDIRYEVNTFGVRCIALYKRHPKRGSLRVAGASLELVDYLLARRPIDLPRGLRELVQIRRNHAAPARDQAA